jgi:hypothetical protein
MYRSNGAGPVPMYLFEAAITLELQRLALPASTCIGRGTSERTGVSNEPAKEYIRASGLCGRGTHVHLNRSLPTLEAWRLRSPMHEENCHYCGPTFLTQQEVKALAGDNMEAPRLLCQTDGNSLTRVQHLKEIQARASAKYVHLYD